MISMEFKASELHAPVCWNEKRGGGVLVVHVDDFLCIRGVGALM